MISFKQYLSEGFAPESNNPVNVDVWHGTGRRFSQFKQEHSRIPNDFYGGGIGYFTSDKDVGKTYAKSAAKTQGTGTPLLYQTSLKMNNVFDVDHQFTGEKLKNILPPASQHEDFARGAGLMGLNADKYKVLDDLRTGKMSLSGEQIFKGLSRGMVNTAGARRHLISKGYDGLRYNGGVNMQMAKKHDVYIPYNAGGITINKRYIINK
jgi:hypothetical protein